MGKSDSFNKKTSITTSNINTAYSGTNLPIHEAAKNYGSNTNNYSGDLASNFETIKNYKSNTPVQDGPFLTNDSSIWYDNKDAPITTPPAYAETPTSGGTGFRTAQTNTTVFKKTSGSSGGIYESPAGHETTKNLDKNPHLGKMLDTMESQKKGNYGFDPLTGASVNSSAPKKGQWFEVTSTYGERGGSKMWISENKKLNAQGLQNVLNNQAADRRYNQFLKTEWRPNFLLNTNQFVSNELPITNFDSYIDTWNVSDTKKTEFKKDIQKRIKNLNFAWNPSGSLPKGVKEKKGPGKSSKDNQLTSWGGWDSKKTQKGNFAIGGYDITANPNKYDKKKLDALKKLSDPNYSF